MKIAFLTLGCKVNKYETDLLKERFEKAGHIVVDFDNKADMYVINSCSVTNMSDRKTRQMISKARAKNPEGIIAVIGCSVQSNKERLENFNDVDIILGNDSKMDLYDVYLKYSKSLEKQVCIEDIGSVKEYKDVGTRNKGYEIREAIKIEDGCNNFCSYCVIPYTRGRVRSRELDSIYNEAISLVKSGVKELILVGIEVASYGLDKENISLFNILDKLDKIEGLQRIRLSSMEPRFLTEENLKKLATYTKLCPHFHISMQSGNTEVLKRMNRKYTKETLIEVALNIKKYFKDAYLASDIIVGFPGETDEEFMDTKDTVEKMDLTEIHVFKYSKRQYTRAAKMDGQVDGNVKKQRSEELLNISKYKNKVYLSKYVGEKVEVLFENYTNGVLTGYTPNYIKVKVEGEEKLCGTIQGVVVTSLDKDILLGKLD